MGSSVGKYWYTNIGCVDVAVPSIASRRPSRGTVPNILLPVEEPKEEIGMDPGVPNVDESFFNSNADWKEFYCNMVEYDPH